MMRGCFWLAAAALLIALPASAQAPPAPAPKPCVYTGAAQDETVCRLAIVRDARASVQDQLDQALAAASIRLSACSTREAELATWFEGYFGKAPR